MTLTAAAREWFVPASVLATVALTLRFQIAAVWFVLAVLACLLVGRWICEGRRPAVAARKPLVEKVAGTARNAKPIKRLGRPLRWLARYLILL